MNDDPVDTAVGKSAISLQCSVGKARLFSFFLIRFMVENSFLFWQRTAKKEKLACPLVLARIRQKKKSSPVHKQTYLSFSQAYTLLLPTLSSSTIAAIECPSAFKNLALAFFTSAACLLTSADRLAAITCFSLQASS